MTANDKLPFVAIMMTEYISGCNPGYFHFPVGSTDEKINEDMARQRSNPTVCRVVLYRLARCHTRMPPTWHCRESLSVFEEPLEPIPNDRPVPEERIR